MKCYVLLRHNYKEIDDFVAIPMESDAVLAFKRYKSANELLQWLSENGKEYQKLYNNWVKESLLEDPHDKVLAYEFADKKVVELLKKSGFSVDFAINVSKAIVCTLDFVIVNGKFVCTDSAKYWTDFSIQEVTMK